jgi:hypothetical protein
MDHPARSPLIQKKLCRGSGSQEPDPGLLHTTRLPGREFAAIQAKKRNWAGRCASYMHFLICLLFHILHFHVIGFPASPKSSTLRDPIRNLSVDFFGISRLHLSFSDDDRSSGWLEERQKVIKENHHHESDLSRLSSYENN